MVELFINGTASAVGQINLYGDEPLSLNISIQDVRDISKRNSTFSQTFTIPADKNNNILLNHIFNIGADSSFDPSKKTPSYILNDGMPVFSGQFQLTKINVKNRNVISYECVVYGDVIDLVKSLGSKLIIGNENADDNLDFSELDHIFTADNIVASWTADTKTLGYYYPLIDYGYDLSLTNLNQAILPGGYYNGVIIPGGGCDPGIFRPALSNTYLFKKIIEDVGFSIDGDFIDSEVFAETIIPFNGSNVVTPVLSESNANLFQASKSVNNTVVYQYQANTPIIYLILNDDSTPPNFDNGGNYDITTYKYTSPIYGIQKFYLDIKFKISENTPSGPSIQVQFYRSGYLSGTTPFFTQTLACGNGAGGNPPPTILRFSTPILNTPISQGLGPVQIGESFWVSYQVQGMESQFGFTQVVIYKETYFYNSTYTGFLYDSMLYMNDFVPKKIKQVDYIKSVITMFNLMVVPNKYNAKRLLFIPRNEYYAAGQIKDWTNKIDHTEKIEESLISEQQNRVIKMSYKEDKDTLNVEYKEKWSEVYGEYRQVLDNEWIEGEKKTEVIFSPTPVAKVYGSFDIFCPVIASKSTSGVYGRTEHNIRFLRKNPTPMPSTDSITMIGYSATFSFPYCGHLDHPINPLVDYNFGIVREVYYEGLSTMTPHNLVYDYWKEYLDNINDKNSKLIKCKIYLTPDDIAQFNYNDSIYIEGLTDDGGHYFIVNKINFIPTSNLPSTIELMKVTIIPQEDLLGREIPYNNIKDITPVSAVILGRDNQSQSGSSLIIGDGNTVGYGSENSLIIGNNNLIQNNISNVILINSNNQTVTEPFTTIVGNTYFPQEGDSYTLFNDIDSGLDEVLYPFANTILNDIDSGLNAVRNIGGQSIISDIDSGLS